MITVICWTVLLIGALLIAVGIHGALTNKTTMERVTSFVSALIYMCVFYLSFYDLFLR